MQIIGIILYAFRNNNLLSQEGEGNGGLAMIGNAVLKLVVVDNGYDDHLLQQYQVLYLNPAIGALLRGAREGALFLERAHFFRGGALFLGERIF